MISASSSMRTMRGRMEKSNLRAEARATGFFHEVVADHVADGEVLFLDTAHVGFGDVDTELGKRSQLPAITARKRYGAARDGVGVLHGADDIGGVAAATESHHDVAGPGEILELFDEDVLEAAVVG